MGKDIGFGIHRSGGNSGGSDEVVRSVERVQAHTVPSEGELVCSEQGTYKVVFDNTYSMFSSKTVKYSVTVTPGASHADAAQGDAGSGVGREPQQAGSLFFFSSSA